jgi:tetratricopeptide (TPR) repeat protein
MALATLAYIRLRATEGLRTRDDLVGIIADLRRALELDPQYSSAYNWLALALGRVGFVADALDVFQRCRQVDPLFAPCAENEYDALFILGRFDEAHAGFLAALERGTVVDEYVNFSLLAHFGERTAFLFAANQHLWLPGWRRHEAVYEAYRNLDADHSALVEELLDFSGVSQDDDSAMLRNLLVPLGAHDLLPFPILIWGPDYARYRQSPQFQRFVRESGAFDYWQAVGYPPQCRPLGADGFQCD